MDSPQDKSPWPEAGDRWQADLRRELGRRVPPAWRDRLVEELTDHLSDLQEEAGMDAFAPETRLGSPHQIANLAAAEYRKLGFFARRPLLTYVGGPLLFVPLAVVATLFVGPVMLGLVLECACWLLGIAAPDPSPAVENAIFQSIASLLRFLPFPLAAWFFCRLARRHGRSWRSTLTAGAIVSLYALFFTVTLTAKTTDAEGLLMIGLGLPPNHWLNFLQAAAPLAIVLYFLRSSGAAAGNATIPSASIFH